MSAQRQASFAARITPIEGRPMTLVSVTGGIDMATAGTLREALDLAVEPGVTVIVDFAGVELFDSVGAAVLDSVAKRAQLAHGRLTVRNPEPGVQSLLQTFCLDELLEPDSRSTSPPQDWSRRWSSPCKRRS